MEFLKKHGEKIFFTLCLIGLGASAFLVLMGGGATGQSGMFSSGKKGNVEAVDTAALDTLLKRITGNPETVGVASNAFTSTERRRCVNIDDPALIPLDAKICPYCGMEQTLADPDSDGDGVTDKVERQYGMDPANPKDVFDDLDSDGFPNGLEITSGFDPTSATSHPPLFDGLRVKETRRVVTRATLRGQSQGPTKWALQISMKYPGQPEGRARIVYEGSRFGRSKEFHLLSYSQSREFKNGKNYWTREAKVKVNGETRILSGTKPLEVQNSSAILELMTDPDYSQRVRIGETFELDGKSYNVIDIKTETVVIQAGPDAPVLSIRKRSPEETNDQPMEEVRAKPATPEFDLNFDL